MQDKAREATPGPTVDTDVLVIGTHFGPPCSGHLVAEGKGYRFESVAPGDA